MNTLEKAYIGLAVCTGVYQICLQHTWQGCTCTQNLQESKCVILYASLHKTTFAAKMISWQEKYLEQANSAAMSLNLFLNLFFPFQHFKLVLSCFILDLIY